ncbi:GTP pyrophosphokinase ywaC [Raoultella terrigena]|uniref:GTP pyrophosphokinase n=1 Tax=Raoultella terrigena TaxID=577 RepID=UPI000E00C736|nr:RelA/SpoT domain-containing protein [Raoultella terrigena]SUQ58734.1 GTP pyrophosphokinase ywaC [Raoultella terrigena]
MSKERELNKWIDDSLPKFELLGKHIAFIIETLLQQNNIVYLSVSYRTKTKDGIIEKIGRKNYRKAMEELTDVSGVRVILYLESDIAKVSDVIKSTFNVDEKNSMSNESRLSSDKIGYRSVHYVCDIGNNRTALKEYEYISGLKCEIQVRTMLQHAWAELTHDRNYKIGANLPLQIQRKINLFSGMLEIVDEGFSEIVKSIDEYRELIKNNGLEQLFTQEMNSINLYKFVQEMTKKMGLELTPVSDWEGENSQEILEELKFSGLNNFKEIADAIPKDYSEVHKEFYSSTNIYGFLRDIMLIHDYEGLVNKSSINWVLASESELEELKKHKDFYSNFMGTDKAEKLVQAFTLTDE